VTVVAALTVGLACALAAGALTGALPKPRPRRPSPRTEQRRMWLQQAGVAVTPAQFAAGSVAAGCVTLVAVAALTGSTFVGLVPALAVTAVPRVYFGRRRRLRLAQVQHAWPDGLRDLLASISAGRSLTQSVVALAEHGPPALREAFAGYPSLARSLGTVAALEIVKEELADPTSDRVIEVLVLAHDRGGGIVRQILEELLDATTKDLRLRDALETEGLEMRINARAVVVLPWLVLVALTARPGPFRDYYRSGAGLATLLVAGMLTAVGVGVLGRLGRDDPEPRVFVGGERP
jgi:tight adherence protein B